MLTESDTDVSDTAVPAGHPADRLMNAIDRCSAPVCVGIDPVLSRIPAAIGGGSGSSEPVAVIGRFVQGVIGAVSSAVPCVKFQSACYERYGWEGVRQLEADVRVAAEAGLEVILDAKRGDIGISAEHYAASAFEPRSNGGGHSGWITINGYLGRDGITPFLSDASRGAFVLVRTSNPGGDALQGIATSDGRTIADEVASMVSAIGDDGVGARGFSSLGAVIGATKPSDASRLRSAMPRQIFLVPGYGAQGGGVDDVLPCFHEDGTGAVVTASRSVLYPDDGGSDWTDAVKSAAERLADDIGTATGHRN